MAARQIAKRQPNNHNVSSTQQHQLAPEPGRQAPIACATAGSLLRTSSWSCSLHENQYSLSNHFYRVRRGILRGEQPLLLPTLHGGTRPRPSRALHHRSCQSPRCGDALAAQSGVGRVPRVAIGRCGRSKICLRQRQGERQGRPLSRVPRLRLYGGDRLRPHRR